MGTRNIMLYTHGDQEHHVIHTWGPGTSCYTHMGTRNIMLYTHGDQEHHVIHTWGPGTSCYTHMGTRNIMLYTCNLSGPIFLQSVSIITDPKYLDAYSVVCLPHNQSSLYARASAMEAPLVNQPYKRLTLHSIRLCSNGL